MSVRVILLTCLLFLLVSCEETALDRYYNQDGNFSGSVYGAIDSTGLYTYFLQGVDSTEFANQLENTLVTVIAPSDAAFEDYMSKHGYSSFDDIPRATLEDLIGQHILTWPHSPTSLEIDPFYYKRQSNMAHRTVTKTDPILQEEKTIVSEAKYVQFYFPQMFEHYNGTLDDYELLTGGTSLSPTTEYCIYDIPVDSILPYGNGWVYYIDQVLEPVQNLDDWMMEQEDFSLFNKLFNRYTLYYRDDGVNSSVDVKRSNLFQNNRYYRIDMELCFETVGFIKTGSSYISLKGSSGYTVLAPQNTALESFIDATFTDYPGFKESLNTVSKDGLEGLHIHNIARSLISPYMFVDKLFFPSNFMSEEGVGSLDGTNFKLASTNFTDYKLCSNGYAYGIDKYVVPRTFKSILKPSFTSPEFKYFTSAVLQAKIAGFLNDADADYTLMLPTDSAFIKNNIVLADVNTYNAEYGGEIDPTNGLTEAIFVDVSTATPRRIEIEELFSYVFSHLFTEGITPTGQKQFVQNSTGDFVGFTSDSVWSGGNLETRWTAADTIVTPDILESIAGTDNGQVYIVDNLIKAPTYSLGHMISTNPSYERFKDICESSGLLTGTTLNVYGNYPTALVPTNEAIDQFISDGNLPSTEKELQDFVKYFFVDKVAFTSEIYDETASTLCKDEENSTEFNIVYKMVDLEGTPGALQIKGVNNTVFINIIEGDNSNIICTNGLIHQIDGVLN